MKSLPFSYVLNDFGISLNEMKWNKIGTGMHPYVSVCYSYVSVCYSYVSVCYPYVPVCTRMFRVLLVCS